MHCKKKKKLQGPKYTHTQAEKYQYQFKLIKLLA